MCARWHAWSVTLLSSCFSLSLQFGAVTMMAGIIGLLLGTILSQYFGSRYPRADPLVCGFGLFVSAPFLVGATYVSTINSFYCYALLFFGQVALNLNWAIVCDILLVRHKSARVYLLQFINAPPPPFLHHKLYCTSCVLLVVCSFRSNVTIEHIDTLTYVCVCVKMQHN